MSSQCQEVPATKYMPVNRHGSEQVTSFHRAHRRGRRRAARKLPLQHPEHKNPKLCMHAAAGRLSVSAPAPTHAYLNDAGGSGADCMIASILSSTSGVSLGSTSSDFKFSATCTGHSSSSHHVTAA